MPKIANRLATIAGGPSLNGRAPSELDELLHSAANDQLRDMELTIIEGPLPAILPLTERTRLLAADPKLRKALPKCNGGGCTIKQPCPNCKISRRYLALVQHRKKHGRVVHPSVRAVEELDGELVPLPAAPVPANGLVTRRMSAVKPVRVRWIWDRRVPAAKLTIIQGDAGMGKTWLCLDIIAHVTTGRFFCDGSQCAQADVLFVTGEDGIADTIRPRLDVLKADASRVHYLDVVRIHGRDAALDLESHLDLLNAWLAGHRQVRLAVLDPLAAFLGNIDSHRNSEVRGILGRLAKLAETYDVAIVGINHLTKALVKALHRSLGSIAFVAAARAVWQVSADPDDEERRLLLPVKMNLCRTFGLAFRVSSKGITWEDGAVRMSADDAESEQDETPRAEAKDWLRVQLAKGPVPAKDIEHKAREDGIAMKTLKRAKKEMGIVSQQSKEGWSWIPEGQSSDTKTVSP